MKALFDMVEKILQTDDKLIIVSQWSNLLDVIASHLESMNGVTFAKFTGNVAIKDRPVLLLLIVLLLISHFSFSQLFLYLTLFNIKRLSGYNRCFQQTKFRSENLTTVTHCWRCGIELSRWESLVVVRHSLESTVRNTSAR